MPLAANSAYFGWRAKGFVKPRDQNRRCTRPLLCSGGKRSTPSVEAHSSSRYQRLPQSRFRAVKKGRNPEPPARNQTQKGNGEFRLSSGAEQLLRAGENASVKLEGFPTRTFRGEVVVVSPKGQVEGDDRVFYARVGVANPDGAMRPGMQGRGKIFTGWSPAGKVIFRRPAMWMWTKLWSWVGW